MAEDKRSDLFTPELEQLHQQEALSLTRDNNKKRLERGNTDALTKTDQGLGERDQEENNYK